MRTRRCGTLHSDQPLVSHASPLLADRRKKPLESRSADTRTRTAKIVIDDRHIRPAESASPFREAILTPPALMIIGKLVGGGLPDVDESAALQMVRRDLHRFPPSQR